MKVFHVCDETHFINGIMINSVEYSCFNRGESTRSNDSSDPWIFTIKGCGTVRKPPENSTKVSSNSSPPPTTASNNKEDNSRIPESKSLTTALLPILYQVCKHM